MSTSSISDEQKEQTDQPTVSSACQRI